MTWTRLRQRRAVGAESDRGVQHDRVRRATIARPATREVQLNLYFFGAIEVDIEGELAQLGPTGYRPLQVRDTLF